MGCQDRCRVPLCARGPGDHARPDRLIEDGPPRLGLVRKGLVTCAFATLRCGRRGGRHELTDEARAAVDSFLPVAGCARAARNLRRQVDGIRRRVRAGCPWRDVSEPYELWSSPYRVFRRHQREGVRTQALDALRALAGGADRRSRSIHDRAGALEGRDAAIGHAMRRPHRVTIVAEALTWTGHRRPVPKRAQGERSPTAFRRRASPAGPVARPTGVSSKS
ncbi:transposase [Streptomyces sp. NPDC096153]|uniref:transposase n=1 Tax=Streptomyces sp. NPDC096153 TaxID=3155548 RepID=UPI00331BF68D